MAGAGPGVGPATCEGLPRCRSCSRVAPDGGRLVLKAQRPKRPRRPGPNALLRRLVICAGKERPHAVTVRVPSASAEAHGHRPRPAPPSVTTAVHEVPTTPNTQIH